MNDQRRAVDRFLGDIKPLPLRIAGEVAWKSIKVRLSRSLVTVSSVVLAVAFLMVVLCGDVVNRAVYGGWSREQQSIADVGTIRDLVAGPRPERQFLVLLADEGLRPSLSGWAAPETALLPVAQAATWLGLVRWIEELKATDRFKLIENQRPLAALSALDRPAARSAFVETAATFRGVRLPVDAAELEVAADSLPALRSSLDLLVARERFRLVQVEQAGGPDAVLDAIRDDAVALGDLPDLGVPIDQAFTGFDPARLRAAAGQLRLDQLRQRAHRVVKQVNQVWSSGRSLTLGQVYTGTAEDPRLTMLHRDMAAAIGAEQAAAVGAKIAAHAKLTAAEEPVRLAMEGTLKLFNRSFAGRRPISLAAVADGSLAGDPRQPLLEQALIDALGPADLQALRRELGRLAHLTALSDSLMRAGFSPDDASEKTFWLLVLSLLVCIVGIVNSMMMAVTERFREIATMKCLGAMDGFILKAFLIESGSVGLVGSVFGVALGVLVVLLQGGSRFGGAFWTSLPVGDFLVWALFALGCGLVLTILGALLPAYQAARMHPIEAMRLEA